MNKAQQKRRPINAKYPTERKRLKVVNLQNDLQLTIAKAKSDYESNLALNYTHTHNEKNQYFYSIKGRENFPAKMYYCDVSATSDLDKAQSFNDYFIQYSLLLQAHYKVYWTCNLETTHYILITYSSLNLMFLTC